MAGFSWRKVLEGLGLADDDEGGRRVRLAPGVVGNTTTASVFGVIALAAEAYFLQSQPQALYVAMPTTVLLLAIYMFGTWRFADKHPDLALMGGSELLQLRRLQLGAKDQAIIIEGQPSASLLPNDGDAHG